MKKTISNSTMTTKTTTAVSTNGLVNICLKTKLNSMADEDAYVFEQAVSKEIADLPEDQLIALAKDNDEEAKVVLFANYFYYILSLVNGKKFLAEKSYLEPEDIFMYAYQGFENTLRQYDLSKKASFSTILKLNVGHSITEDFVKTTGASNELYSIDKFYKSQLVMGKTEKEALELTAKEFNKKASTISENLRAFALSKTISLDTPMSDDGDCTIADMVAAKDDEEEFFNEEKRILFKQMLSCLSERDYEILCLMSGYDDEVHAKYGYGKDEQVSGKEIAKLFGVSEARISQIGEGARKKIFKKMPDVFEKFINA